MNVTTNTAIIWDGKWESKDGKEHMLTECWAVCPECNGEGTTGNPVFNGVSLSDMDPYERNEFVRKYTSGAYDVKCSFCNGRTTVKGYDLSSLSSELREEYDLEMNKYYMRQAAESAERKATGCW